MKNFLKAWFSSIMWCGLLHSIGGDIPVAVFWFYAIVGIIFLNILFQFPGKE